MRSASLASTKFLGALSLLTLIACGERDNAPNNNGDDGGVSEGGVGADDDDGGGVLFDTPQDGAGEAGGGAEGSVIEDCEAPPHSPCDENSDDPAHAIGLNCPGELEFDVQVNGADGTSGVGQGLGNTDTWDPIEGKRFLALGSGYVGELDDETPADDISASPTYCNDMISGAATLPDPIRPTNVGNQDCFENTDLVGMGDCSNTIQEQFEQGMNQANDYTEMRIKAKVPGGATSLSYNFAFFSTEYPEYFGQPFNDMYIAWLESERWTGNISFDEMGKPISLNAGFLDYKDDAGNLPEFDGTCMKMHGGTKWLSTTAPVSPGDDIELVFAIFDLSDAILDSYVIIDNFAWGCEGELPPATIPIG